MSHDELWPGLFAAESAALATVFDGRAIAIHHVGSTSVPGLPAKPIIDILVVVDDIGQVDSLNPALIALGYEPQGEYGLPGRRFFTKGGDVNRSHQLHVFQHDHPEVSAMLDFRDYLRSHPSQAAEYGRLKERRGAGLWGRHQGVQRGQRRLRQGSDSQGSRLAAGDEIGAPKGRQGQR